MTDEKFGVINENISYLEKKTLMLSSGSPKIHSNERLRETYGQMYGCSDGQIDYVTKIESRVVNVMFKRLRN